MSWISPFSNDNPQPGDRLDAETMRTLIDAVQRLYSISTAPPLNFAIDQSGIHFWLDDQLDIFSPGSTNNWYSLNNFYNTTNFYEVANFYNVVNFNEYFTWQPIFITDPTTNIVLDPGTAPKLQIVTGPFVWVDETQLGNGATLPEIQRFWVVNATGGTFGLVLRSADATQFATAAGIAWNAAAGAVQAALNTAAATFTVPYTVGVTGAGTAGSPWIVTFSGFAPYAMMLPRYDPLTGPALTLEYVGISGGTHGRIITIENTGPGVIVLDDAGSAGAAAAYAANQGIFCPLQLDYSIWPDNPAVLEYDAFGDGVHGGWRFMHPTLGTTGTAGFGGPFAYSTQGIEFLGGLTWADLGNGLVSVSVDWTQAPAPCSAANEVTGTTTTSSDGIFTAGANTLTIPESGNYLLFLRVSADVTNTSGSTVVQMEARLMVNGAQIQIAPGFHTFSDKQAAGCVNLTSYQALGVGDVVSAECRIFKNGTASFDYTLQYLEVCPAGGS